MPKQEIITPKHFLIVDAHADTLSLACKQRRDLLDFPEAQMDLTRIKSSGVILQFFAVFVNPVDNLEQKIDPYLEQIAYFHRQLDRFSDLIKPVFSVRDLPGRTTRSPIHCLLSVEGGECLERNLSNLYRLYDLGVRGLGLTWNHNNALGCGANDTSGAGLTDFGRQVVRSMNHLGMVVDAAHLSESSFWDVLGISESPIIVSHANCRTIKDHPRNLSDNQMRALARADGVMGITLVNGFLGEGPGIGLVLDHIIHACGVMGTRHVGIGTDFDGVDIPIPGLEDASRLPLLAEGLIKRGLSKKEVSMIMGENLLRLLRSVL